MTDDVNNWLMSGGTPWARFDAPGDVVEGDVVGTPVMRQARDFDSGLPATWPDGNPMMEAVVTLATEQRSDEYEDDDGLRLFVVNSGNKRAALKAAIQKAGAKGLENGGRLWVRYTHDGVPSGRGRSGPKQYQIAYKPPVFDPASLERPEAPRSQETGWNEPRRAPKAETEAAAAAPWGTDPRYSEPPF